MAPDSVHRLSLGFYSSTLPKYQLAFDSDKDTVIHTQSPFHVHLKIPRTKKFYVCNSNWNIVL